jgi:hypothetical protein
MFHLANAVENGTYLGDTSNILEQSIPTRELWQAHAISLWRRRMWLAGC